MQNNSKRSPLVTVLLIVVVVILAGIGLALLRHKNPTPSSDTVPLGKSYCNSVGQVCFSYPKSWSITSTASSAIVTDPSGNTKIVYSTSLPAADATCPANTCQFTGLSAIISNGFPNGNDVAGTLYNTTTRSYLPEYFLISSTQLLHDGLAVDSTVNLHAPFLPTFINTNKPALTQTLMAEFSPSQSYTNLAASKTWFSSSSAKLATDIINSARKQ